MAIDSLDSLSVRSKRCTEDRLWGPERNDGVTEVLAVLLLNAGYVDDASFGIRRPRIKRWIIHGRIDLIDFALEPLVELVERMVMAIFHICAGLIAGVFVIGIFRCGWTNHDLRQCRSLLGVHRHHGKYIHR
jgi:hypothetical protein